MSRKTVSKNIAYDDKKKLYYVTFRCRRNGKSSKFMRCYSTLEEALLARENGMPTTKRRNEDVTLAQWLDYWLNEVMRPTRAVTTIHGYQKIIENHLKPGLGSIRLRSLTPIDIQQYMTAKQRQGLCANTIRKHHVLLKAALTLAVRQELISKNVAQLASPPPEQSPQHTFYTAEQIQRLFQLTEGRSLEPVVKLAAYLGLRRSEICGLKWRYVDLEQGVLCVREARTAANGTAINKGPKSPSSMRRLSFAGNEDVRDMLKKMYARYLRERARYGESYNPQGFVLTYGRGRPYSPDYLSAHFSRTVQQHGLPPCTLHGLRHSFASIANSQHVPMFSICKALGHSSTAVTSRIYLHLFDETHQDVVDLVGQAIAAGK